MHRNRNRTIMALAAFSVMALLSVENQASAMLIFSEDFNGYSGTAFSSQPDTGLQPYASGTVSGWSSTGLNDLHAVDLDGAGDFAIMFFEDNVMTLTTGIAANDAGQSYNVEFDYGAAVGGSLAAATEATDSLLVEVLRTDNSVLASDTFSPGAWGPGNFNLDAGLHGVLNYTGDGSGNVRIRVGPTPPLNSGNFEGEIDNLTVSSVAPVPEPSTLVLMSMSLVGLATFRRRRQR